MNEQITTTPKEQAPLATLRNIITGDKMRQQFEMALPKHLSPERFARVAITALTRTPKLVECTQASLFKCLLDLSALGLEPDGRRAHLIPYGKECTLIIDWKGLAELAMRSGLIAKLHADIVCENDEFSFNLGAVECHKIDFRKDRGAMYAAYALAETKDGAVFVQVLTKAEIDGVRKRSRASGNGPWVSDYNEMAKKTAFRRLSKWLPLSAEFRDALDKDDASEPAEIDVTPKQTVVKPLNPFSIEAPQAEPEPEPQVIEAEPAPAPEMSNHLLDMLLAIRDAGTADRLTDIRVNINELADEEERAEAKNKLAARAEAIGCKWDTKRGAFIKA